MLTASRYNAISPFLRLHTQKSPLQSSSVFGRGVGGEVTFFTETYIKRLYHAFWSMIFATEFPVRPIIVALWKAYVVLV